MKWCCIASRDISIASKEACRSDDFAYINCLRFLLQLRCFVQLMTCRSFCRRHCKSCIWCHTGWGSASDADCLWSGWPSRYLLAELNIISSMHPFLILKTAYDFGCELSRLSQSLTVRGKLQQYSLAQSRVYLPGRGIVSIGRIIVF